MKQTMEHREAFRSDYRAGVGKFHSARQKAFWQEMLQHITGKHHELLNFGKVRRRLHLHERILQGCA